MCCCPWSFVLHKGAFVSSEQLQSGALPSHKHPIFSENRYKGPYIPGENNMSPGPHLVLWQQIYSQCKGRAKRGHVWRLITGDFPVWSEPRRLKKKVDIWSGRFLPSVLLMAPAVMTPRLDAGQDFTLTDQPGRSLGPALPWGISFCLEENRAERNDGHVMFVSVRVLLQ